MATRTRTSKPDAAKSHRPRRRALTAQTRERVTPPSAAEVSSAVHRALELVPASVRTEFVEAVADHASGGLDESLWGGSPSAAGLRSAALQGLKDDFVARRDLLSVSLSRSEVAELLGVSPQAVLDRLRDGDLLGLKDGREWRIPMWQVNASAERGFVPGIAELRHVFPGGVVALSRWATTPNVDLDAMAPAEALAAGRVEDVIAVAETLTAAAW